jgi:calcium release-activated calcium channel protein 1
MAQAVLTALDTLMTRKWREQERTWRKEERQWREEDMVFREEERAFHNRERELRNLSLRWREEDMKQRRVNNSRYVWARLATDKSSSSSCNASFTSIYMIKNYSYMYVT